jgi:hypothetical protein
MSQDQAKLPITEEQPKKHAGGRPRIFQSPEEMQVKIEEYFKKCDSATAFMVIKDKDGSQHVEEVPKPARYTIPGLAYHLGFCSRQQLPDYAREFPEFSDTISRARLRIEEQRITDGTDPDTRNSNGIKFDLSNNFKYKDLQTIEIATAAQEFITMAMRIILQYVPADKQAEARQKLEASIDFND